MLDRPASAVGLLTFLDREGKNGSLASATLRFADDKGGKLFTKRIDAGDVARLLKVHKIPCAVLSSCESARADVGDEANLCRIFLKNGVTNVLAMSYQVSDSMCEAFYKEFYRRFFLHRMKFSDAASHARQLIEDQRERRSSRSRKFQIQDYFVPVTYMNGRDVRIAGPSGGDAEREMDKYRDSWISLMPTRHEWIIWLLELSLFVLFVTMKRSILAAPRVVLKVRATAVTTIARHREFQLFKQEFAKIDSHVLDMNMLRVENDLRQERMIFLHSAQDMQITTLPLIRSLVLVWKHTNFIKRPFVIRAECFLQPWKPTVIRHIWPNIKFKCSCHRISTLRNEGQNLPTGKAAIIIMNLHKLYPGNPGRWHKSGQREFKEFLQQVFQSDDEAKTQSDPKPYLILVGQGEEDLFNKHLGNLKFLKVICTRYTQVPTKQYSLEGKSW